MKKSIIFISFFTLVINLFATMKKKASNAQEWLHCTGQLYGNVLPHNNENNSILTSSPLPVCSTRRPLLQCTPLLCACRCRWMLSQLLRLKPSLIGAACRAETCVGVDVRLKVVKRRGRRVTVVTILTLPQQASRPQGRPLEKQEHESRE